MNDKTKNKKVISKNTKGKQVKNSRKGSIFKSMVTIFDKYLKLILGFVLCLVLLFIIGLAIKNITHKTKIMTIDGVVITKSDFMIYLYSSKYNYFGKELDNITEDDLNVVISEDEDMTVKEYLKQVAISDIKTASAIKLLANKNNIQLNEKDYDDLEKEKKSFISELGGKKQFKRFLKTNKTTEESFDSMSQTDKLYEKLLTNLYGENKLKDLSDKELDEANKSYESNYIKLKQIILTTIDINTGKSLSVTAVNQKETLAKTIVTEAKDGKSFDDLIKTYSEDAEEKEAPYYVYYKKGELLSELEDVAFSLEVGQISDPIKTDYAIHIIQVQELDDSKLNEHYDKLREEKCIEDLKDAIDDLKVVYHDAYEKIKIK